MGSHKKREAVISQCKIYDGQERGFRGCKHLLLLQKTWIWFLTLIWHFLTVYNSSLRGSDASLYWLPQVTGMQSMHTYKIIKSKKKGKGKETKTLHDTSRHDFCKELLENNFTYFLGKLSKWALKFTSYCLVIISTEICLKTWYSVWNCFIDQSLHLLVRKA